VWEIWREIKISFKKFFSRPEERKIKGNKNCALINNYKKNNKIKNLREYYKNINLSRDRMSYTKPDP